MFFSTGRRIFATTRDNRFRPEPLRVLQAAHICAHAWTGIRLFPSFRRIPLRAHGPTFSPLTHSDFSDLRWPAHTPTFTRDCI